MIANVGDRIRGLGAARRARGLIWEPHRRRARSHGTSVPDPSARRGAVDEHRAARQRLTKFANRLHLLNGLLHGGHTRELPRYVEELLGSGPLGSALPGIDAIRDPFVQAFLAAKAALRLEAGVTLTIGANTWVPGGSRFPSM